MIGYRRRIRLPLGLVANVSRRGVGVSAGVRGARVSASSSGRVSLWLSAFGFFLRRVLR